MLFLTISTDNTVSLTETHPNHQCWVREVQTKEPHAQGHTRVTLVSQIPQNPYIFPTPTHVYSIPVLKSNLQKAVRRGQSDAAMRTAFQMLSQGQEAQTELFRRLPIILLEDTLLDPLIYPRWVWWMLAQSRGYSLSEPEIRQLLADVGWIANADKTPFRDHLSKQDHIQTPLVLNCSLFCIWIRAQWGGMHGDMAWLRGLYDTWTNRSERDWNRLNQISPPMFAGPFHTLGFQCETHGLSEAVDFHCCTAMRTQLAAKHKVSEQEIQEAIWWHRSGINVRTWFHTNQTQNNTEQKQKQQTRELFAALEHELEPYVERAWKPLQKKSLQTSFLSFLKPG